jgi:glycosyltransferase involved in cell wall biosynthesis
VGSRLDFEVTDEFVEQVLLPVMQQGIVSVFMGVFDDYSKRCQKYPTLGDSSVFVGFVKDVQAVNEICDVYVNPRRNGGGTSVVEAMAKKLPPVTLNYGDVALGAGEDFWVEDYDDMVQQILRLQDDEVFYQTMSEKAYERMKVVTDTSTVFWNTFEIIRRLPEFQ